MTRAQETLGLMLMLASVYLALYMDVIPLPEVARTEIVPVLPLWLLVSFGAYLLFRLGWGILTFNDVPEAHKELMGEIDRAKVELRDMGVEVE